MTPRLAVTREQVDRWDELYDGAPADRPPRELRLRLPERPTMPCPECGGSGRRLFMSDVMDCTCGSGYSRGPGSVPIPEGTRVRIEYPCDVCDGSGRGSLDGRPQDWLMCGECNGKGWHPVAFATLTEVHAALADGQPYRWYVTLSDIKPVEADQ